MTEIVIAGGQPSIAFGFVANFIFSEMSAFKTVTEK